MEDGGKMRQMRRNLAFAGQAPNGKFTKIETQGRDPSQGRLKSGPLCTDHGATAKQVAKDKGNVPFLF
jgi:hypothetical protein